MARRCACRDGHRASGVVGHAPGSGSISSVYPGDHEPSRNRGDGRGEKGAGVDLRRREAAKAWPAGTIALMLLGVLFTGAQAETVVTKKLLEGFIQYPLALTPVEWIPYVAAGCPASSSPSGLGSVMLNVKDRVGQTLVVKLGSVDQVPPGPVRVQEYVTIAAHVNCTNPPISVPNWATPNYVWVAGPANPARFRVPSDTHWLSFEYGPDAPNIGQRFSVWLSCDDVAIVDPLCLSD